MTLASRLSLSTSTGRAAKLVRPLHASQLAAPETEQPGASPSQCVDAFLDQLVELPLAEWLAIGEAVVAERELLPVRRRAWDEVEAKLLRGRFGVVVWTVRDAVDTAAYIASRESHHWSRHERGIFAAAHGAAEATALALLARVDLSTETYRALARPFAKCLADAESRRDGRGASAATTSGTLAAE